MAEKKLISRPNDNPFEAPSETTPVKPKKSARIRNVGIAQKRLLWAVLVSFTPLIFPPLFLLTIPFQMYSIYALAKALKMSTVTSLLLLLLMFIPLVSLIVMLVLSGKATTVLQEAGIRVGLMGARMRDLPPVA